MSLRGAVMVLSLVGTMATIVTGFALGPLAALCVFAGVVGVIGYVMTFD